MKKTLYAICVQGAGRNPIQFSSKYQDETPLLYYGSRFYQFQLGRWCNRDRIGEEGGLSLYAFVQSDPQNSYDYLGYKDAPNWNRGKPFFSWRFRRQGVIFECECADPDTVRRIKKQIADDLWNFVYYAKPTENVATLRFPGPNGLPGRKGVFDTHWFPDLPRYAN